MPYLYVLAAIVLRLMPHPWNVTPVAAMFLFSGCVFRSRWQSLLMPLSALLVSDWFVVQVLYPGRFGWFSPVTWSAFLLIGLIGWTLREKVSVGRVAAASLSGSVLFFLVTNFGEWAWGVLYPRTFDGLVACYTAALPFFRNTVAGDLFYSAVLFGSYFWLVRPRAHLLAAAERH